MNILVGFFLNKNDRGKEKNNNKRGTPWTRRPGSQTCCTHEKEKRREIAQQRTVYRTVLSSVYRTVSSSAYCAVYSIVYCTV